jgi:hypothetical protein
MIPVHHPDILPSHSVVAAMIKPVDAQTGFAACPCQIDADEMPVHMSKYTGSA